MKLFSPSSKYAKFQPEKKFRKGNFLAPKELNKTFVKFPVPKKLHKTFLYIQFLCGLRETMPRQRLRLSSHFCD